MQIWDWSRLESILYRNNRIQVPGPGIRRARKMDRKIFTALEMRVQTFQASLCLLHLSMQDMTISDIMNSAFGSAGQRCMAASILIIVGKGKRAEEVCEDSFWWMIWMLNIGFAGFSTISRHFCAISHHFTICHVHTVVPHLPGEGTQILTKLQLLLLTSFLPSFLLLDPVSCPLAPIPAPPDVSLVLPSHVASCGARLDPNSQFRMLWGTSGPANQNRCQIEC